MNTIEWIRFVIMIVWALAFGFKSWRYLNKWETLIAIYYSIRAVWLLIIINLH